MADQPQNETEMARLMAAYLFTSPGYNRDAPVTDMVKARINAMARDIAAEIVSSNTELVGILRTRMQEVLRQAMQEDTWLQKTVINAAAKALHDASLHTPMPEDP